MSEEQKQGAKVYDVNAKQVAIVPETLYEKGMSCPFCKSTAKPNYLSELNRLPTQIADLLQCSEEECGGVYLILSTPRTYLQKPIILNWQYSPKGVEQNGTQEGQQEQEQAATS